jgi:hypothetical protein
VNFEGDVVDSRVARVPFGKVGYCNHRNLALENDVQNNFEATPNAVSVNSNANAYVKK